MIVCDGDLVDAPPDSDFQVRAGDQPQDRRRSASKRLRRCSRVPMRWSS